MLTIYAGGMGPVVKDGLEHGLLVVLVEVGFFFVLPGHFLEV